MWDFDACSTTPGCRRKASRFPNLDPVSDTSCRVRESHVFEAGTGIHDSSSSLAPYIMAAKEPFILVSTGTWCISMNPYNHEALTADELGRIASVFWV